MRKAPILERIRRWTPPRLNVSKNFNGGGQSRGGRHGWASKEAAIISLVLFLRTPYGEGPLRSVSLLSAHLLTQILERFSEILNVNALRAFTGTNAFQHAH
jgi:hypothetical protein